MQSHKVSKVPPRRLTSRPVTYVRPNPHPPGKMTLWGLGALPMCLQGTDKLPLHLAVPSPGRRPGPLYELPALFRLPIARRLNLPPPYRVPLPQCKPSRHPSQPLAIRPWRPTRLTPPSWWTSTRRASSVRPHHTSSAAEQLLLLRPTRLRLHESTSAALLCKSERPSPEVRPGRWRYCD